MYDLSDSEDDCYYNFPQRLEKLKKKHARNNLLNTIDLTNVSTHTNGDWSSPERKQDSDVIEVLDEVIDVEAWNFTPIASNTLLEGVTTRSRRSKRKDVDNETPPPTHAPPPVSKRGRGRGRGRSKSGRGAQRQTQNDCTILSSPLPRRGRGWGRGFHPTDYPDASEQQELFSSIIKKPTPEVQDLNTTLELDESLLNEELSVKVYWQHSEVIKFNIRRLQKLTQIFDFFVDKQQVSRDRLLFTYNDTNSSSKILHPDDTPDSINYNIAKFIDGGIIDKEFKFGREDLTNSPKKKGFMLKFQCESKKKPLELTVGKDEKLKIAMIKCAEDLELPVASLMFKFDGEVVQDIATPNDLEMESGDCIDVKIIDVNK